MTALLVGGDKLGNIPEVLKENGISKYIHWTGRKKKLRKSKIPKEADIIIMFYDFLEHNITNIIKNQAKGMNKTCIYSKRAVTDLEIKLKNCEECKYYESCKKET